MQDSWAAQNVAYSVMCELARVYVFLWVKLVSRISATPVAGPCGTELSPKAGSTH